MVLHSLHTNTNIKTNIWKHFNFEFVINVLQKNSLRFFSAINELVQLIISWWSFYQLNRSSSMVIFGVHYKIHVAHSSFIVAVQLIDMKHTWVNTLKAEHEERVCFGPLWHAVMSVICVTHTPPSLTF